MSLKPSTRRSAAILILLLLAISIAIFFMNRQYYMGRLLHGPQSENDTVNALQPQSNEHLTIVIPADSLNKPANITATQSNVLHDSSFKKPHYIKGNQQDDQSTAAAMQANMLSMVSANATSTAITRYQSIPSISPDASMVAKKVNADLGLSLMFYPIASWSETFVILPATIAYHHKLSEFLYRDYSGVVYPIRKKVQLVVNGAMQNVELIRMKGPQPSEGYPEYVMLNGNPPFIIFGDYWNSNRWFIYQNDKITTFSLSGISSLDSLK